MKRRVMEPINKKLLFAYVLPFAIFLGGLALVEGVRGLGGGSLLSQRPEYWVYPLQTLLCGAALVVYWGRYDFGKRGGLLAAAAAGRTRL